MIVADASVVIALAKICKLRLLKLLYEEVVIAPQVKIEVVDKGRTISTPEVRKVEKALEKSWIREVRPISKEKRFARRVIENTHLHEGEAESLALAFLRKLMVLIDDKEARAMAEAIDLEYLGSAGVLLEAFIKGFLDYGELENAVRDLGKAIWLSPDAVAEILKTAREVKK